MLGIILIYYIGKSFYTLAGQHDKSEWGYGVLGVVMFYVYQLIAGIGMGLSDEFGGTSFLSTTTLALNIIGIFVGGIGIWLTYIFLEKRWKNSTNYKEKDMDILDGDIFD